jgi:CRISPR/Cas system-associated exonuclease Cas4 (RecB family)
MAPLNLAMVPAVSAPSTRVVFRDSLGERRHVPDSSGADTLELLSLRTELTSAPSFEFALRERTGRLGSFHHAYYARVRGVERLGGGAIGLVSAQTPGVRLSQILDDVDRQHLPFDITTALALLRQLVPAVAVLHESARDVAHGAIGPERLVVTPNARLVIVEHVLGTALEQLRLSHADYWRELRIPVPRSAGSPCLDQRADVMQIGAVALALILGRLLREDEYLRFGEVVASAWATSVRGGLEPLPHGLRSWLMRALQLDPATSFPSALEARAELDKIIGESDDLAAPQALETFLAQYGASVGASTADFPEETAVPVPFVSAVPNVSFVAPVVAAPSVSSVVPVASVAPVPFVVPVPSVVPAPFVSFVAPVSFASSLSAFSDEDVASDAEEDIETATKLRQWPRLVAVAAVLIAIASGVALVSRRHVVHAAERPVTGTLAIDTNPTGAAVVVDGQQRGLTPLNLTLGAGAHVIELSGAGEPRSIPVTIVGGTQASQFVELRQGAVFGQLQVRTSPVGARITLDGVPRGVSPLTIADVAPGVHAVVLESDAGSAKQEVTIEAGIAAMLVVALGPSQTGPGSGWISIAAPVEMQVNENGRLLGSSATERIMVPAGKHEIEVSNIPLMYRSVRTVQVSPGKVAPIKIELPQQRLALQAIPWAEVWVDGEKVGETPIGDLKVVVGPHEVLFRHPDLGEQRHAITVTAAGPARLSVDLRKK